ncbi:hypothetical protein HMPREF1545_03984 [Oscillibacter sp. KLE 1728]|nr:hypothetical protein HMPREF1545_03984 [Oscillibacter sp. KLE 1728]ERK59316.1 hypothetical protein HMPREF1546_03403 [Oscillibacter sp. KLE 1745]
MKVIWYSIAQFGKKGNHRSAYKDFVNFYFFVTVGGLFMLL